MSELLENRAAIFFFTFSILRVIFFFSAVGSTHSGGNYSENIKENQKDTKAQDTDKLILQHSTAAGWVTHRKTELLCIVARFS